MAEVAQNPIGKHVALETQREVIIDAAIACFNEFGYDRTSLDTIASRCGLPVSVVSQHFASKADIQTALIATWAEQLSAWITNA